MFTVTPEESEKEVLWREKEKEIGEVSLDRWNLGGQGKIFGLKLSSLLTFQDPINNLCYNLFLLLNPYLPLQFGRLGQDIAEINFSTAS